jgi:probable HAF family extracellular repeat protein
MASRQVSRFALVWCAVAIVVAPFTATVAQERGPTMYHIVDLGTLGGTSSEATGMNLLGDVTGSSTTTTGSAHAFLYSAGRMLDLGTLPGGTQSSGTAISDNGSVVGFSGINEFGLGFREFVQGFVWRAGDIRAVGALYCPCSFNRRYGTSRALALNSAGLIVGESVADERDSITRAFLYEGTSMRALPVDGAGTSTALAINDSGDIAGVVNDRAFLIRNGTRTDLGVLQEHATSQARAVNAIGQVAGNSFTTTRASRAFVWDLGALHPLNALPGDFATEARAINISGDVVGRSGTPTLSTSRAVLWRNGTVIDLNTRVQVAAWSLQVATGINDVGQIVGNGVHDGQMRAFLLTPQ